MRTTLFKSAKSRLNPTVKIISAFISLVLISLQAAMAQDGNAGINQATSQVKSYFDTGTNLMYAIGAIIGLVGAIKVLCAMNCLAA